MKTVALKVIVIAVVLIAIVTKYAKRKQGLREEVVAGKWNKLINNKNPQTEIEYIKALTDWTTSKKGYLKIIGKNSDNEEANMLTYNGNLALIKSVDVIFYWDDKHFKGKNWIPLKKENVYQFTRDE